MISFGCPVRDSLTEGLAWQAVSVASCKCGRRYRKSIVSELSQDHGQASTTLGKETSLPAHSEA